MTHDLIATRKIIFDGNMSSILQINKISIIDYKVIKLYQNMKKWNILDIFIDIDELADRIRAIDVMMSLWKHTWIAQFGKKR